MCMCTCYICRVLRAVMLYFSYSACCDSRRVAGVCMCIDRIHMFMCMLNLSFPACCESRRIAGVCMCIDGINMFICMLPLSFQYYKVTYI